MRQNTFKINPIRNRNAFTMLELVFVVVVLGILAAMAIPRLDQDIKQEAADSILSDIRYTQHLALNDDKHSFSNPNWQRAFWRIGFNNCSGGTGIFEYIGSDDNMNGGTLANKEAATDPANGKKMIWSTGSTCSDGGDAATSDRIFLSHKFGINNISYSGCGNNNQYIGFDHLGRPHSGFAGSTVPNYGSYLTTTCTITFNMDNGDDFNITIQPETGYAQIGGQPDS